jgi:4-amino-4-deoxy-L-arabinose transferase-like glycosyltransferase
MLVETKRPYLVLLLLVAAVSLPFLNQAFHIDDRIYLEVAENILSRPLHPYDYQPIFEGFQAEDAASHSHLPLTSYYLALVRLVTGSEREWIFHLAFIIFPVLAAWAMYDLARRFVQQPLEAAILLVVSPVFLILSHTLMTDVPLLSFWLLGFSRYYAIIEGQPGRRDWLILTGSLLASAFISVLTVVPLAVMGLATLFVRAPGAGRTRGYLLLVLASPLILWFAWFLLAYFHYGRFVLVNTVLHMNQRAVFDWSLLGNKTLSLTLNLGALFLAPIAVWFGLARGYRLRLALAVLWLAFLPFYVWVADWQWPQTLFFALFLATGLLVLFSVGARLVEILVRFRRQHPAVDSRGERFWILMLWFAGSVFACLFLYYSGSARYALPALPAIVLFWMRELERGVPDSYFRRNLVWLAIILTGGYSLLLGYADYRFANTYRAVSRELTAKYGQPGRTIWITGEWGFRYYMNHAGAVTLLQTGTGPKAGDIIIKPYIAMPWVSLYDHNGCLDLVEQHYVTVGFPVRMLDFGSKAGFYSTGWGLLPFSWKKGERWEWFNVFRVKKEYEGPVPEQQQPW